MQELIEHLNTIAKMKVLNGANQFSIASYDRAAKAIRDMGKNMTAQEIASLDGVGKKIALTVQEFISTGTSTAYKELAGKVPAQCLVFTKIPQIGPKKALKLWNMGYKSFDSLVQKAEANELDDIISAKIGIKSAEEFKKSILFARDTANGRLPYGVASLVGHAVMSALETLAFPIHIELVGSLRRMQDSIKDLDVGVCIKPEEDRAQAFGKIERALEANGVAFEVVNQGDKKSSLRVTHNGVTMACDVWFVENWYWGSFLNYATGSRQHNIHLRALAQKHGLTVSEYGIFKLGTETAHKEKMIDNDGRVIFVRGMGERVGGEEEEDLYRVLGLDYVEPKDRSE